MKKSQFIITVLLLLTILTVLFFRYNSRDIATPGPAMSTIPQNTVLSASLIAPNGIDLNWKSNDKTISGWFLDYSNKGTIEDYITFGYFPATITTFRHAPLAPATPYYYRVRPYFAGVSQVVSVTAGPEPVKSQPELTEGPLEESADTNTQTDLPAQKSILNGERAEAAPTDLTVTISSSAVQNSVILRWEDNASDEELYLVQIKENTARDFIVCAVLPPNTSSFQKVNLEPGKTFDFRVLAAVMGEFSNSVDTTTQAEPSGD